MTQAFMLMCNIKRNGIKYKISAKEYQKLKEDNSVYRKEFMTGRVGNNHGKILSQEWKDNISKSQVGHTRSKGQNSPFKGKTHTQETKDAISEKRTGIATRTGIPFTQEVKDKMSNDRKGKTKARWSEERKSKRAEMMKDLWKQRKTPI